MKTHPRGPAPAILLTAATVCLAALLAVATARHEQGSDAAPSDYAAIALAEAITSP